MTVSKAHALAKERRRELEDEYVVFLLAKANPARLAGSTFTREQRAVEKKRANMILWQLTCRWYEWGTTVLGMEAEKDPQIKTAPPNDDQRKRGAQVMTDEWLQRRLVTVDERRAADLAVVAGDEAVTKAVGVIYDQEVRNWKRILERAPMPSA